MLEIRDKEIEKNRVKVIKALRSGNYRQIKGSVKSHYSGHCVIGVIYEEFDMMEGINIKGTRQDISNLLGFTVDNDIRICESTQDINDIVSMNDHGSSFEEIADYLVKEKGFPNVF